MDTPISDGVLGDRLVAARQAVEQAGHDARAFTTALDAGQAQALGRLVELRARALVVERTSALSTRVTLLERQLRVAGDRLSAAAAPPTARIAPPPDRSARAAPSPRLPPRVRQGRPTQVAGPPTTVRSSRTCRPCRACGTCSPAAARRAGSTGCWASGGRPATRPTGPSCSGPCRSARLPGCPSRPSPAPCRSSCCRTEAR